MTMKELKESIKILRDNGIDISDEVLK